MSSETTEIPDLFQEGGTLPASIEKRVESLGVDSVVLRWLWPAFVMVTILWLVLTYYLYKYRNDKPPDHDQYNKYPGGILRLISLELLATTMAGVVLCSIAIPWFTQPPSGDAVCVMQVVPVTFGLILVFTSICARAWSVRRRMIYTGPKPRDNLDIIQKQSRRAVLGMLTGLVVFVSAWLLVDPPSSVSTSKFMVEYDEGTQKMTLVTVKGGHCDRGHWAWSATLVIFKAFLMIYTMWLAWNTRNVYKSLNESHHIFVLNGVSAMVYTFVLLLTVYGGVNWEVTQFSQGFGVTLIILTVISLFFIPPINISLHGYTFGPNLEVVRKDDPARQQDNLKDRKLNLDHDNHPVSLTRWCCGKVGKTDIVQDI